MKIKKIGGLFFLLILATTITSCSDGGGEESIRTSPSINPIDGTWSGSVKDSLGGNGNLILTISQSADNLSGTWQATFSNSRYNNGGSLSGKFDGKSANIVLLPSNSSNCPFNATVTMINENRVTGTYAAFNCNITITGSLDVSKTLTT